MMAWPFFVAKRYLFSKKSTNAINIIVGIAVGGLALGATALLIVLWIFNGFESLLTGLIGTFNPDLKITPAQGKTFVVDSVQLQQLRGLEGVAAVSVTLEEIAFFEYQETQDFGVIKGVDEQYRKVNRLDSMIFEGKYQLHNAGHTGALLGSGLANKLTVSLQNAFTPLRVYMAKRKDSGTGLNAPFQSRDIYPSGVFAIQQDYDNDYVISSLALVQDLLAAPGEASAYELSLKPGAPLNKVQHAVTQVLGKSFLIKNRNQQDEALLKLMNIEKWLTFAIMSLILLLISFNLVGALWMIVLDKKRDMTTLLALGATPVYLRNIFLQLGLMLSGLGALLGLIIAAGFYVLQKTVGVIPVPEGFVIHSYPIEFSVLDVVVVIGTVLALGFLASIPAARRSMKFPPLVKAE